MNAHGFILPSRVLGLCFLLVAIASATASIWLYIDSSRFASASTVARGTVVELVPTASGDGTTYSPRFEYLDANGQYHVAIAGWSSSPPSYSVGDSVEILYATSHPAEARIRSFHSLWLGSAIAGFMAIVPSLMAMIFIWLIPLTIRRVWPNPMSPAGSRAVSTEAT